MKMKIKSVVGRHIWDSRGRPTVEVRVELSGGAIGRGIAPAGASRGSYEAVDLRDGGLEFGGYGVSKAVNNVNGEIANTITGLDAREQTKIDRALIELDGTQNKSRLGGNALIATSMAVLYAASAATDLPLWRYLAGERSVSLPLPQIQIFGGGAHANRRTDIQDFLVMPLEAQSFEEGLFMVEKVYRAAGSLMEARGLLAGVADEGGWWPNFSSNEDALDVLSQSIAKAGYANGEVLIALDIAASEFYKDGCYNLALENQEYTGEEWLEVLYGWIGRYPIVSVEDPVDESDAEGMQAFTAAIGDRIQVVGDDFLVTNEKRIHSAAMKNQCNAVLVKPNQVGTITETVAALDVASGHGWGTIVSARSGESEDTMISHLSVGWNAGQLKVGSFSRSERMAKWNECLRIEHELGDQAIYAGSSALPFNS
jgi:enolase